jgi:trk system potassium uptake protein TrkA
MQIIICGAGQVGTALLQHLSIDYDIVLIDTQADLLEKIQNEYDVQVIAGNATDPNILKKAGIQEQSVLVAVTGSDEVNLTVCQLAASLFNVHFKAARLRRESYFQEEWHERIKEELKIDLILSPERDAAQSILQSFKIPYAFDAFSFGGNKLKLIGIQVDGTGGLVKKRIHEIYEIFALFDFKIIRIVRNYQAFIPENQDEILQNDALYFLVASSQSSELMKALGYRNEVAKPIIIFGASLVTSYILSSLNQNKHITIVEEDQEKIKDFIPHHQDITFLHGSPLHPEVLIEAGIEKASHTIAVTADDTVNILASLMAHSYGVTHPLALVQRIGYLSPLFALGIEKLIHPSQLIVASLLQKLTKDYFLSFYPLEGTSSGTVIEALVQEKARSLGMSSNSLNDVSIQVLAVVRQHKIVWEPTTLILDDRVILTTLPEGNQRVQRLFAPGA